MFYFAGFKGCILRLEVENKKVTITIMILNMMTVMLLSIMINCFTKVVDDQSGLAGYGSEIDFTDPRLLRNHGPTVRCLDTCLA